MARRPPLLTVAICLSLIGIHILAGPVLDAEGMTDTGDALLGILRHADWTHLWVNILLLAVFGTRTEDRIGPTRMAVLAAACAVGGTLAQVALTGPGVIGASGMAYGLAAFAVLAGAAPGNRLLFALLIAAIVGLESAILSDDLAIAAHIVSTLIGGGYAMLGALFGGGKTALKPMRRTDIARVVAIIEETDEDDALEAEQGFLSGDLGGMFVLSKGGAVVGVTGFALDEQVPDIAWLSWTYLTESETGGGLGGFMLNDLLGRLKERGIRKLFIATSDYAEDGVPIYAAAHKMYADFGAEVELTIPDYHAVGEARIVYGLANPEYEAPGPASPPPEDGLAFTGAAREPETDGVAGLIWEARPAGVAGLDHTLEGARKGGARMAVIALPGDLSEANGAALGSHGFAECGKLTDYHASGLHQIWWICSLEKMSESGS